MTLTEQLKILDDKIKANQAQYDLDRLASRISSLSPSELERYEYLTGKCLVYQEGVVVQTSMIILHWVKFLIKD